MLLYMFISSINFKKRNALVHIHVITKTSQAEILLLVWEEAEEKKTASVLKSYLIKHKERTECKMDTFANHQLCNFVGTQLSD